MINKWLDKYKFLFKINTTSKTQTLKLISKY